MTNEEAIYLGLATMVVAVALIAFILIAPTACSKESPS